MYTSADPVVFYGKSHVTASLGSKHPDVGTLKTFEDGNTYVWAYNDADTDINPGYLAQLNSAATGMSVTVTNATNTGRPIGAVKHATLTTNTYGWLLKRGFGTIEMNATSGTIATRANIFVGANGVGAVTGSGEGPVGYALTAIVSSASGEAYFSI